ncbi:hypothetical protein EG68_11053 [Paragonimus skrjabini miyazakii]|uniref:Uncharacterized protein n=1 Tax=Paragonimus skrjabini miyazakii TaxID=59628 RepID=A0A8S9YPW1_9TREM|nr:hypothetical protein EG68_11053 [Paragonimus skrjabini miyazakii]
MGQFTDCLAGCAGGTGNKRRCCCKFLLFLLSSCAGTYSHTTTNPHVPSSITSLILVFIWIATCLHNWDNTSPFFHCHSKSSQYGVRWTQ